MTVDVRLLCDPLHAESKDLLLWYWLYLAVSKFHYLVPVIRVASC